MGLATLASGAATAALIMLVFARQDTNVGTVEIPVPAFSPPLAGQTLPQAKDNTKPASGVTKPNSLAKGEPANLGIGGSGTTRSAEGGRPPQVQMASMDTSTSRPRHRDRERESDIPKVRWQTETVQRYDRGVIAPAYMVEERSHNGDVVYQPVMMPVTTETGARPLLMDGAPDSSIQFTSLSEETSHK
jgi:hypothetical protein